MVLEQLSKQDIIRLFLEHKQESSNKIQKLETMLSKMQQQLDALLRLLYGTKSEKQAKSPAAKAAQLRARNKSSNGAIGGSGRAKLPDNLHRERVVYDIADSDKQCNSCGLKLQKMGELTSEQLEYVPAKLYVKQLVRLKYNCQRCSNNIVTADLPEQPIAKGLAGPGLLAAVLIDKYQDALPLYRQQQRWQRLGVNLARSSSCDWVGQCSQLLAPIVNAMQQDLLLSPKIHVDDTTLPVQVAEKNKTHTGRLWVYIGNGGCGPPCVVYDYSKTRRKDVPQKMLGNYRGYLQADAYAGYDELYKTGKIIEVACWGHSRRKFYDVSVATKADNLADSALDIIGQLYAIEAKAKHLSPNKCKHYRRRYAKPILRKLKRWLNYYHPRTIAGAPINKAIGYCLNHWRALNNYLRDGRLEIDNNRAERAMKTIVIGRKNYLFVGSHQGGHNAAIIYSIIETCKQNNINTFDYLKNVLARLPSHKITNIRELIPYNWKPVA